MAAPISNNNPALIDHRRVNVSNVAQALGSAATTHGSANIQNADQAAALAQNIAEFFAQNGPGALATHANDRTALTDLLKAS